jgi:D-inositol-3-phosphate glycosyltransferase
VHRDPDLLGRLVVLVVGGPSGTGLDRPYELAELATALGIAGAVRFLPPQPRERLPAVYRAADLVAVPSHNETFGLVALEAQACGTPVVAAAVGGLPVAVADGVSGVLVGSHRTVDWADAMAAVALRPAYREQLALAAVGHARRFSWDRTTDALLVTYAEAVAALRDAMLPAEVAV